MGWFCGIRGRKRRVGEDVLDVPWTACKFPGAIVGRTRHCRGAACRSRRRTCSPYKPPSKWQQPPICHCEEAAGRCGNLGKAVSTPYRPPLKWETPPICHCEEAAGRRGNLGKAVTFSPEVSCYPPRFCEIATGAKRPRNDTSGWCRGAPAPLRGLMLLHKAVTDRRYSQTWRRVRSAMACTGCKCLPEIAPQGHFLALRAQGATSLRSSQ